MGACFLRQQHFKTNIILRQITLRQIFLRQISSRQSFFKTIFKDKVLI